MNNKRKLDVVCSPGTYKRVTTDPEYMSSVLSQMTSEEDFDEIVFSPNPEPEDDTAQYGLELASSCSQDETYAQLNSDADSKKIIWLDSAVKLLLAKVKELRPLVGKVASLKNKKQMWTKIAEALAANGHNYNATQVEGKYFSLERQYKKVKLNNSKTGRSRQSCPYQSELDDLLEEKKSIHPEFVLDSDAEVTSEDLSNSDLLNTSLTEKPEMLPSTSRKRKTSFQEYLEKVEEYGKKKEESDLVWRELMETSIRERREIAARREAQEDKKIELLKTLIDLLKK
ncbi:uncharacterized protein [Musca autumnalis]|uniref:uncharacterized protein n=1 Tax=Musca autumnalis TaxID=221902 RepID=UPI003CF57D94